MDLLTVLDLIARLPSAMAPDAADNNAALVGWCIGGIGIGFAAMAYGVKTLFTLLNRAQAERITALEDGLNSANAFIMSTLQELVKQSSAREEAVAAALDENQRVLRKISRLLPPVADADDDSGVIPPPNVRPPRTRTPSGFHQATHESRP